MAYPTARTGMGHRRAPRLPGGDIALAAAVAGTLSGAPSTIHALATGRSPLAAVRAAATLAPRYAAAPSPGREVVTGVVVHAVLSLGWTTVLAAVLPRRHTALWGTVAGAGIAALDLGVVGRRYPAIARLPLAAQVADHVAFGALAGWVLARRAPRTG